MLNDVSFDRLNEVLNRAEATSADGTRELVRLDRNSGNRDRCQSEFFWPTNCQAQFVRIGANQRPAPPVHSP
jgi:hypothetical protein